MTTDKEALVQTFKDAVGSWRLKQALKGKGRLVVFLIGRAGVGKTTLATTVGDQLSGVECVYPGLECRKKFGEKMFLDLLKKEGEADVIAPSESEDFVFSLVSGSLDSAQVRKVPVVIIDGLPRSRKQVLWLITEARVRNVKLVFLYCQCNEAERQNRMKTRDREDTDEYKLAQKRSEKEPLALLDVIEELLFLDYTIEHVDLSEHKISLSTYSQKDHQKDASLSAIKTYSLERLFSDLGTFADSTLKKFGVTGAQIRESAAHRNEAGTHDLSPHWTREMLRALRDEVDEALDELPESRWKGASVALDRVRTELVDVAHFLFAAVQYAGMDAAFFWETFYTKLRINEQREDRGRFSVAAADDQIVGKVPKHLPRVYLAGPIAGGASQDWKKALKVLEDEGRCDLLDPFERRNIDVGRSSDRMEERIELDLADIAGADLVFAYMPYLSAGTCMEIFYASRIARVPVCLCSTEPYRWPWVTEHCEILREVSENRRNSVDSGLQTALSDALNGFWSKE